MSRSWPQKLDMPKSLGSHNEWNGCWRNEGPCRSRGVFSLAGGLPEIGTPECFRQELQLIALDMEEGCSQPKWNGPLDCFLLLLLLLLFFFFSFFLSFLFVLFSCLFVLLMTSLKIHAHFLHVHGMLRRTYPYTLTLTPNRWKISKWEKPPDLLILLKNCRVLLLWLTDAHQMSRNHFDSWHSFPKK